MPTDVTKQPMADKSATIEDWAKIMEMIDESDSEKWDDARDENDGIDFDDVDLSIRPGFLEAYFSADAR